MTPELLRLINEAIAENGEFSMTPIYQLAGKLFGTDGWEIQPDGTISLHAASFASAQERGAAPLTLDAAPQGKG